MQGYHESFFSESFKRNETGVFPGAFLVFRSYASMDRTFPFWHFAERSYLCRRRTCFSNLKELKILTNTASFSISKLCSELWKQCGLYVVKPTRTLKTLAKALNQISTCWLYSTIQTLRFLSFFSLRSSRLALSRRFQSAVYFFRIKSYNACTWFMTSDTKINEKKLNSRYPIILPHLTVTQMKQKIS